MDSSGLLLDQILFGVFPYVALFTFFFVTIQRYRIHKFTFSSLSSQFLENKTHFWGMVPFHYGLIVVLTGHTIMFLLPKLVLNWNSVPVRLYLLEAVMFAFAALSFIGIIALIRRRMNNTKVRMVTSPTDWLLLVFLLIQIILGLYMALFHRWGSSWFSGAMTPYLWSIAKFSPNVGYVSALPLMVKLHIINAFILIGIFPFTRLVHVLVAPNPYLWRRHQVVRWYKNRSLIAKLRDRI
jgi:nitrate reductase gamma subunit